MAYIHVKNIGSKKYYTLRVSKRKGKKVIVKDICNLGSDVNKINISDLERKYKGEIRKSYKTLKRFLNKNIYLEKAKKKKRKKSVYFQNEQIDNIEAVRLHYKNKFQKIQKKTKDLIMESFLINFAVNSTSIEGNTITLREANKLFKEDIIPKNKTLREVNDLTNTKRTWDFLLQKMPVIDSNLIEKAHDMLLENIDERRGYRDHDIHIFGQPFKPVPYRYIKADIRILLDFLKNNQKIHPLALATFFHHKFESIHPFSDGNGRTGRILMNYLLIRKNYPPLVISRRFRKEYLNSMNLADKSIKNNLVDVDIKHYKKLLDFVYDQYIESYWDTFLIN